MNIFVYSEAKTLSEFFLDFRSNNKNIPKMAANLMKYFDEIEVTEIDREDFRLVLSRADSVKLWGPAFTRDSKVMIALVGRIAMDENKWNEAEDFDAVGGLASKAILKSYLEHGIDALKYLNGNFVVIVHDRDIKKVFIVTDKCGMFPCFQVQANGSGLVYSSHPDILAHLTDNSMNWDGVSFAEFLASGKLSHPYTYYNNIRALDFACIHTISTANLIAYESKENYFKFNFNIDHGMTEWELAEELAMAFRNSVRRRTLPIFGQTGISLSGGLDSRAILCSAQEKENMWAFCFYDEENTEYRVAKEIANSAGVRFFPFKREFDHYGNYAMMGVKISGGMGDFGNNHYLGFRNRFLETGINNIITGFYCDYFFKGLALNKSFNKLLRSEKYTEFAYDNYMPFYKFATKSFELAKKRLDEIYTDHIKSDDSDMGRLKIESKRLFPLSYEPDNQETLIPQRVMGWYLPIVDNDIIDVYLKIPPNYKLNTSMYSKAVELLCGKEISRIPNVNTGAPVNASRLRVIWHSYQRILHRRFRKKKKSIATDESWPNWMYYIKYSSTINTMWQNTDKNIKDVLTDILGYDPYTKEVKEHAETQLKLFLRLLTLKLWLEQRS